MNYYIHLINSTMPDCKMCGNNSDKCYTVDLAITSAFDRDEQPFE